MIASNMIFITFIFSYKSGVVSLEITDISVADQGRYTASFTTPLGMFDTNVHFDFSGEGEHKFRSVHF